MPRHDQNDRTTIDRVDPLRGTVLDGKYLLETRLASGGFGAIYQARHVETGVELAVKVVHARLASDPGVVARFQREGETLTALRSPHTITAYELGETADGVLYIAMELLRGVNLFERFREVGALPWRRMVAIALGVCDSLAEAHALGVVHRDLKPTNIHLERRGADEDFVKVLDFGIAKILQHSQLDSADLTTAGLMIGTIDYMSPEQMVGGEITGASDLYTLGIVMYEMIAGKRPFPEAPSAASVLAAMLKPPPPLASVAIVPAELDRVVMRCLARDPADRYQTAEELAADLARLLAPGTERSRAFDLDDDATQIAPKRTLSATITVAAAPPPSQPASLPGVLAASSHAQPAQPLPLSAPRTTPSRPGAAPPRTTAPLPATAPPRRMTPTPSAIPPSATATATVPVPLARPSPTPPPPPSGPATVVTGPATAPVAGPGPGPGPGSGAIPLPINTLRGIPIPQAPDATRTAVDATVIDLPHDRREFDMSRVARRDAAVRRLVWICVLVLAALAGAVVAARL